MSIQAFCDGACRGNPGRSSAAFAVYRFGELVTSSAHVLPGLCTNNEAEYAALKYLLLYLCAWGHERAQIFCDSTLVVNTVNEVWDVKHEHLKAPCNQCIGLLIRGRHTLTHVKGHAGVAGNELCDKLCNDVLDKEEESNGKLG